MKFILEHQLFWTSFFGLCSFIAVFFFWTDSLFLLLLLLCISVLMLVVDFRVADVCLYVFVGISGSLSEMFSVFSGVWDYAEPHIFGIPYWLPFLWGIGGLYIVRLSRFLCKIV